LQPRIGTPRQTRPIAPTGGTPSTPTGGAPVLTEEEQKNVHKCKNFLMTLIQLAQELVLSIIQLLKRTLKDQYKA